MVTTCVCRVLCVFCGVCCVYFCGVKVFFYLQRGVFCIFLRFALCLLCFALRKLCALCLRFVLFCVRGRVLCLCFAIYCVYRIVCAVLCVFLWCVVYCTLFIVLCVCALCFVLAVMLFCVCALRLLALCDLCSALILFWSLECFLLLILTRHELMLIITGLTMIEEGCCPVCMLVPALHHCLCHYGDGAAFWGRLKLLCMISFERYNKKCNNNKITPNKTFPLQSLYYFRWRFTCPGRDGTALPVEER